MLFSEVKVEEKNMTIDSYTKIILTIIALSTSILALKGIGIVPVANAKSDEIMKVQICDKYRCARVGNLEGKESANALLTIAIR